MTRTYVTVALLLFTGLAVSEAAASDRPKEPSKKKVEKINAYLEKLGINNPKIKEFTHGLSTRVEDGGLRIAEEQYEFGRVVLLYEGKPKISSRLIQLKFQPADHPSSEVIITRESAMYYYQYKF